MTTDDMEPDWDVHPDALCASVTKNMTHTHYLFRKTVPRDLPHIKRPPSACTAEQLVELYKGQWLRSDPFGDRFRVRVDRLNSDKASFEGATIDEGVCTDDYWYADACWILCTPKESAECERLCAEKQNLAVKAGSSMGPALQAARDLQKRLAVQGTEHQTVQPLSPADEAEAATKILDMRPATDEDIARLDTIPVPRELLEEIRDTVRNYEHARYLDMMDLHDQLEELLK